MKISTDSHEKTLILGDQLGKCLKPGDIVLLFGDLGAGKTTLTQGICQGLGLEKGEYIRSPTFTLVNLYKGRIQINHIDLYRLDSFAEIDLIEWSEKLRQESDPTGNLELGIEERIEVHITIKEKNCRTFDINVIGQNQRSLTHIQGNP